jgi:hypothetical protein
LPIGRLDLHPEEPEIRFRVSRQMVGERYEAKAITGNAEASWLEGD